MLKKAFMLGISSALLLTAVPPTFASSLENNGEDLAINKTQIELPKKENFIIKETLPLLPKNITILEDTPSKIVVKEVTGEGVTISTNNKFTQILTVEKYEKDGSTLTSSTQIDLNEMQAKLEQESSIAPLAFSGKGDIYQHTITNREYDIKVEQGKAREWRLRSTDSYKYVTQTPDNKELLEKFQDAVENVNTAENSIIAVAGAVTLFTFITAGVGAAIAGAGGAGVGTLFVVLEQHISKADYHFGEFPRSR